MSATFSTIDSRLIVTLDIFWHRVSFDVLYHLRAWPVSNSILVVSLYDIVLLSSSLGGLLTVIFPQNLFLPLIPAAAISFTAFVVVYFFVLEPASDNTDPQESVQESDNEDASQTLDAPGKLNKLVFANIVIGSFLDNVGSLGIYRK